MLGTHQIRQKLQVTCSNCSLSALCIPRGLVQEDINRLSQFVRRKRILHRGDSLYREGDSFHGLLAIKAGTAKLISHDKQGNEHLLGVLLPGELLGFDALSTDTHNCSAVALETLSYCELPAGQLDMLCQKVPNLLRELFRHVGQRLDNEKSQLILHRRPAEERVAAFLVDLSERYRSRGFPASDFRLSLTRQEIGDFLGLALETVSRLLKQFQKEGLIRVQHKNIHIADLDRLKAVYNYN